MLARNLINPLLPCLELVKIPSLASLKILTYKGCFLGKQVFWVLEKAFKKREKERNAFSLEKTLKKGIYI